MSRDSALAVPSGRDGAVPRHRRLDALQRARYWRCSSLETLTSVMRATRHRWAPRIGPYPTAAVGAGERNGMVSSPGWVHTRRVCAVPLRSEVLTDRARLLRVVTRAVRRCLRVRAAPWRAGPFECRALRLVRGCRPPLGLRAVVRQPVFQPRSSASLGVLVVRARTLRARQPGRKAAREARAFADPAQRGAAARAATACRQLGTCVA